MKRNSYSMRQAFTMIELVMVIVVLGIVSMIATDIIASMYRGYIQTKIVNDLEQKTEILINQVAKRLQFRIKPSMIAREISTNNFLGMNSLDLNTSSFDMVEWIGYDYESYEGEYDSVKGFSVPGWSGFIDVENPNTDNTQVVSSGSDLAIADRTMLALSYGDISLNGAGQHPALIFKCRQGDSNLSRYGWDGVNSLTDHNYTLAVTKTGSDILNFVTPQAERNICEQYYLAWTAYALVPEAGMPTDDFNLTLRYNYQPWYGESYTSGKKTVIAEHVSTFRVMQVGETIRVKVCIQDGNITGEPVGFCKEKAIF